MSATLTKSEQLVAAAEQFRHVRAKGTDDALSAEDQQTYDSMLAGARSLEGGKRSFAMSGEADGQQLDNGLGSGARLFNDRGQAVRGLTHKESFVGAVREQMNIRGMNQQQQRIAKHIEDRELSFGSAVRAFVVGANTPGEYAALSGGNVTGGGYTVPEFLAAEIIDKFRARMVMQKAGATTIPLQSDTHTFAKLTGDATAAWRQESTTITESAQTFGALTFYPKSLAVYVKVSRELLQDSPNINSILERSFSAAFAVEMDRVGLLGQGSAAEPLGLYNDSTINAVTSVGALSYYNNVIDAYKLILDDNAPDPTAYITSIREWDKYAKMIDGTGKPVELPPAIRDVPILNTSAIPTTQGGGTESSAFLGYFPDFVFGIRTEFQIQIAQELFAQTGEVGFFAHLRADTGVFHPESFCKLTGITP